jgi:ubiquinone/menaquinone biosynthesis C-methylase UbiE
MNTTPQDMWSDYWNKGDLHACTREFSKDARRRIETKWASEFSQLCGGASVLDLATGNGALIASLPACLPPSMPQVKAVGIDLASIENSAAKYCQSNDILDVEFRGGINVASLPFEDEMFDLVTSQYGVEYADFSVAFKQACRVARDRLVFLVHAADGVVVRQNFDIVRQVAFVVDEIGVFQILRDYLYSQKSADWSPVNNVFEQLRREIYRVENKSFLEAVVHQLRQLVSALRVYPTDNILAAIDGFEASMKAHGARMAALNEAAKSKSELETLLQEDLPDWMQAREIEAEYSDDGEYLVGYWIKANRI